MKPSLGLHLRQRRLEIVDVGRARPRGSRTLIGALQAGVLRRERPGSPNTRCASFGKVGEVLIDEGVAGAAEAVEPVLDVGGVARLRHFAVVDEVDAGIGLLPDHLGDRRAHARGQRRAIDRHAFLLGVHHPDQIVRPRQAAGVGGQEALGAAFHRFLPAGTVGYRLGPHQAAPEPLTKVV